MLTPVLTRDAGSACRRVGLILAIGLSILLGGCFAPSDPETSDIGIRLSHGQLQQAVPLCKSDYLTRVVVYSDTGKADYEKEAVLWDARFAGKARGQLAMVTIGGTNRGQEVLVQLSRPLPRKVSIYYETASSRSGAEWDLRTVPELTGRKWLNDGDKVVNAKDLRAANCDSPV